MKTIEIDGSFGEGGGQILRTALSLSCITGSPMRLYNIRKGRKKPGLMPQHLTCVHAAAAISSAQVQGAERGSTELGFIPRQIKAGTYSFDITTAGSVSLVMQTLLPPLISADAPSRISVKGGTHVPFSPPFHYMAEVFLPMLRRIGIDMEAKIQSYGFYPRGGGQVNFTVHPCRQVTGLQLSERGALTALKGYSGSACLPPHIAQRQKMAVLKRLKPLEGDIHVLDVSAPGAGTFIFLSADYENVLSGFSSLGKRGKPAEEVGRDAADEFLDFHYKSGCLEPHLADQLVLYLSMAGEDSCFTTSCITGHLVTNLWVIEKFLNMGYEIQGKEHSEGTVRIIPAV